MTCYRSKLLASDFPSPSLIQEVTIAFKRKVDEGTMKNLQNKSQLHVRPLSLFDV